MGIQPDQNHACPAYGGDRGGQLPAEAPDKAGVSENLLFSKTPANHRKTFDMAFFDINYGFV
jgi:hypothetical protein